MKLTEPSHPYTIAWNDKNGTRHEKEISRQTPFETFLSQTSVVTRLNYYKALVLTKDPYLAFSLATSRSLFNINLSTEDEVRAYFTSICHGSGPLFLRPASMSRNVSLSWEKTPEMLYIRCHCRKILKLDTYLVLGGPDSSGLAPYAVLSPCVLCPTCSAHFFPVLWKWNGPVVGRA